MGRSRYLKEKALIPELPNDGQEKQAEATTSPKPAIAAKKRKASGTDYPA